MRVARVGTKRNKRWCNIGIAAAVLLALNIIDYFGFPYGGGLSGHSYDRGENGLWLRYTWYFGDYSSAEVTAMARRLREEHIRYAYFHVRSVKSDGTLAYRHPEMRLLAARVHDTAPRVKVLAWIYIDQTVPLKSVAVRRSVVEQARWLTSECGCDGIQYDYEPCATGDPSFLKLLDLTRSSLPRAFVSVAAPTWYPWPLGQAGWTESYFREVGMRCNQIAVMCYDTGFVTPRSYDWLVREQAARVPTAAKGCQILFGLPCYPSGGPSHNPRAENLRIALHAIRNTDGVDGIALFADYTMSHSDWEWYQRAWLAK